MKKRTRLACLLAIVTAQLIPSAEAGQQTGTIDVLFVRQSDGLVYVQLSGTATSRAWCGRNSIYWMIKNENSDAGKRQYAALVAARLAASQITIRGTGDCFRWGDAEDIDEVLL